MWHTTPKPNLGSGSLWAVPITFDENASRVGTAPEKLITFIVSKIRHRVPKSNLGSLYVMQIIFGAGVSVLGKTIPGKWLITVPKIKYRTLSKYQVSNNFWK